MSDRIARITTALIVVAALDLCMILVTGATSPLVLGRIETGAWGVAMRAATLLGLMWLRYGSRRRGRPAPRVGVLLLLSLLLPTLVHFHVAGGRLNGDGLSYYVFVRSLNKDRDFDLTNEYTHYGMIGRGDLQVLTDTGLRRSIYSIGPAICWTPVLRGGRGPGPSRVLARPRRRPLRIRPSPQERRGTRWPLVRLRGDPADPLPAAPSFPALHRTDRRAACLARDVRPLVHGLAAHLLARPVDVSRRLRDLAVGPRPKERARRVGLLLPRHGSRPRDVCQVAERRAAGATRPGAVARAAA